MPPDMILPTWLYHPEFEPVIVKDRSEFEAKWASGWRDTQSGAESIEEDQEEDQPKQERPKRSYNRKKNTGVE